MVGQVDLGIGPAPIILLIEAPHHLPGDALKRTELLFQIGEDLFVPIVALVADGHAGELFIDRQEAESLSTGIPANNGGLSLNWYSFTCGPALVISKSGLRGQGNTPGQV